MTKLKAAVVGLGYWGPNLARNLAGSSDFVLSALCDLETTRLEKIGAFYPAAAKFTNIDDMLATAKPDLVCIATPVASHHGLATRALLAGAHAFVEKPMTLTSAESRDLLATAKRVGRRVFVDHTFLFTGAVQELKRQIGDKHIGELQYIDSVRINLGLFQPDVDVIWDLAPHDLSILQHVVGETPKRVRAMGSCHSPSGLADVAYLHLEYSNNLTAHLHLSWLSPVKVRRMIFAGTRQSVIYDDLEAAEKVKIYDHGVEFDVKDQEARRRVLVSYRKGDMRAPNISATEALSLELQNVAQALRGEVAVRAPGEDGAAVVRILEAAQRSLEKDGASIMVEDA